MFSFVYHNSKNCIGFILLILALSLISTIVEIVYPSFISFFIDQFIIDKKANNLLLFVVFIIGISVLSLISMFVSEVLTVKLSITQSVNIYRFIIYRLVNKDCVTVERFDKSYLAKRIYSDVQQLSNFVIGSLFDFAINSLYLFGSIFFIYKQGFFWLIFFALIIALYSILYNFFRKRVITISKSMVESESVFFSSIFLYLKHLKQIKIHDIQYVFDNNLNKNQLAFYNVCTQHSKFRFYFSRSKNILNYIITSFLFISVGYNITNSELSAGAFVALSGYYGLGLSSVGVFFNLSQNYFLTKVCYERIQELINLEEDPISTNSNLSFKEFNIVLKNVAFKYPDSKQYLFRNFNYKFCPGRIYLIVGDNGRGKSTLINLLIGLFACSEGDIIVSGHNFNNINLPDFRYNYVSYMEQFPFILPLSIRDNITLFRNHRSYNSKVVSELSNRLLTPDLLNSQSETELENSLSGGEKQKISFIRTMSKDLPFIILDEPTTSVDSDTRMYMADYINSIHSNRVVIIISHDESFIKEINNYEVINLNILIGKEYNH